MTSKLDLVYINQLKTFLRDEQIRLQEPMKQHTSFKIGGPCDYFLRPSSIEELRHIIQISQEMGIETFILGKGSNLLVTDKGFRGAIIQIHDNLNQVTISDNIVYAQAGVLLVSLASAAAKEGLTGLEFASGIPGTLGGAVYMNAGAYGGEMAQVIKSALVVFEDGSFQKMSNKELEFAYRYSVLQEKRSIAVEVEIQLEKGDKSDIRDKMYDLNRRRKEKQPLEMPSAGSTFKRPKGHYTGKLIMDAGLRGYRIGDAMVSDKHCGFVVNAGQATFEEVYQLIQYIQHTIKERYGVELTREVKIIGDR